MNPNFLERTKCPACDNNEIFDLYSRSFLDPEIRNYLEDFYSAQGGIEFEYLENADYVLTECKQCALIFQRYVGNDLLMARLYERWIDPEKVFRQVVTTSSLNYYLEYSAEIANVISYFKSEPSKLSFFDFGMGWGKWLLMAKAFGCNAYGTELSETRIKHARDNGINIIQPGDLASYEFDFINSEQVFEHLTYPLAQLKELKDLLKPGGIIKISVPNGRNIKQKIKVMDWGAKKRTRNSLNHVAPLEHINCFNHDSLVRMAKMAGLEKVDLPWPVKVRIESETASLKKSVRGLIRNGYRKYLQMTNQTTYLFFTPIA